GMAHVTRAGAGFQPNDRCKNDPAAARGSGRSEAPTERDLLYAGPGLAAAEQPAERASLDPERIGVLERDVRRVGAAVADVGDLAVPAIVLAGLHVGENLVGGLALDVAAQSVAASLDADLALLLLGPPQADRARSFGLHGLVLRLGGGDRSDDGLG